MKAAVKYIYSDSTIDRPRNGLIVGGVGGAWTPQRSITPSIQMQFISCIECCCSLGKNKTVQKLRLNGALCQILNNKLEFLCI